MFPLLAATLSMACEVPEEVEFVLYGSPEDVVPPSPPVVEEAKIWRGTPPRFDPRPHWGDPGCEWGGVDLTITVPDDDVGYLLEVVEGRLPDARELDVPTLTDRPMLWWRDGDDEDQEPVDFVLALTAIDRTGNLSEPVEIEVSDPGSAEGCGCRSGTGSPSWIWVLVPLVFGVRRGVQRADPR